MADIAWVRKYRPRTFDEYMGNNDKNLIVNRFKGGPGPGPPGWYPPSPGGGG